MTLTVRIDHRVEQALIAYCTAAGRSKSEVLKESLAQFLTSKAALTPTPFELGADLFAQPGHAVGPTDLSSQRKSHLKQLFNEKHTDRRGPADRSL
jgi:hypothetical protein